MRRVALLGARSYWAGRQNHDPTGNKNERLFDQNRQLVQPKGCVLTRAYARATAGTPKTQNMDTVTSVFDYSYAPDPALDANGHHTEIVLPAGRYGGGYTTTVTGGSYTVSPGAGNQPDILTVASSGPGQVSVYVVPTQQTCSVEISQNLLGKQGLVVAGGSLPTTSTATPAPDSMKVAAVGLLIGFGILATPLIRRRPRLTTRRDNR
jgi:hypothetical protein